MLTDGALTVAAFWDQAPLDLVGYTYQLGMARTLLDRYRPRPGGGDLRTWEWYHFRRMLHGDWKTLAGHAGPIYHAEYSRDGTRLATSGEDGARVWNAATGALVLDLREHKGSVNWIGFSPDGARLATTSDDRTVGVWGAAEGHRLLPPLMHRHKVVVVLFTPDSRRLISYDRGGIITTCDSTTGTMIRSRKVADQPIEGMDLSPDGSVLAVAASHEVTLWDYPAMERRLVRIRCDERGPQYDCVAFSHDGRRFATAGGADHHVRVWDFPDGRLVRFFIHHADERVFTVAFSPDDRLLLSTASDEAARLWDLAKGECVGILAGHSQWIWSVAWAPDGHSVATGAADGTIKLWGIPHRGAETRFEPPSTSCAALAFSPDGRSLLTATYPGHLAEWEIATAARRRVMPFRPRERSVAGAFAPGAKLAVVADARGTITIGEPARQGAVLTIPRAAAARPGLTFSGDGKALTYIAADGAVVRLEMTEQPPRPSVLGSPPSAPSSLAFAPDGSLLAGDVDGRLFAFEGMSGAAREAAERGHRGRITHLVVSPDGSLCASGGEDTSLVLWDRATGRIRARLSGHRRPIDDLVFTPDGKTLVSVADRVQLWNVATAEPTIDLIGGLDESSLPGRLAVSPDGASLGAVIAKGRAYWVMDWRADRPGGDLRADAEGPDRTSSHRAP